MSHFEDAYDFYKPARITTEYPIVDGHLSNSCYIRAIDKCYERYAAAWERRNPGAVFSVAEADHVAFHLPHVPLTLTVAFHLPHVPLTRTARRSRA